MADCLRKGMWAKYGAQIGIIAQINGDTVEFHATDSEGLTTNVANVPADAVSQIAHADIPEARRPAPSVSKALGYL